MRITFVKYVFIMFCILCGGKLCSQGLNIDSCIRVLKTSREDTNKVILLNRIAWDIAYTNLKKGLEYSTQSIELAKKLHYESIYARLYNTKGAIYGDMAEVALALDQYIEGLKYAKKCNQPGSAAALYNSLGNLYGTNEEPRKALSNYLLAIDALAKSQPGRVPFPIYSNLIGVYTVLQKYDSAMYYANTCIEHNIKINDREGLTSNYIALSEIYSALKNKEECLIAANKGVVLAREMGDEYTMSHAYVQLGNALSLNGRYQDAFVAINEAIFYSKKTGDMPALELATLYLSQIYENSGDYKSSLKTFKEYTVYKDSALNNESIQQVKNAEAKFENEKKQKEIELLGEKQKLNEAESQKKRVYLYMAVFGIVILGFVLAILYRNNVLKQKTNKNLQAFNKEINLQKDLVELKNKEITDSINYAKRIQQSILTSEHYFKKHTTDFFILFKPKDIVSGDFYWALHHENRFIVMTADCTGHGVPGAMMSMMGINFLNEIVNEKKIVSPAGILNQLRKDIIKALNPEGSMIETKDGLDCCLCSFDFANMNLKYANANNNFYIIREKEIIVSKANKMPVGAGYNSDHSFQEFEVSIQKNDLVITFTDGYADQFGGPKGKKFKYKQLEDLLFANAHLPLSEIKEVLNDRIESWKGNLEQVDDICVMGIKI
ncbi:MAG: SpoIIE family protein phosphatase [Bacteroidota bacterium]